MQQGTCENSALTTPVDGNAFYLSRSDEVGCQEADHEETHQYGNRRESQDTSFPSAGFRQGLGNSREGHSDDNEQYSVERCRPFYNDIVPLLAGQQECATEEDQSKGTARGLAEQRLVDDGGHRACSYPREINRDCVRPRAAGIFIPVPSK